MLAIHGGAPTIRYPFTKYNSIGIEEQNAALRVLKSGNLSSFIGANEPDFYGGSEIKAFENEWSDFFNVKHSITVNSWTSGLETIIGAYGFEPFGEIITSPWTMCATAAAILHWNLIPVFADINEYDYNISAQDVEAKITDQTVAIMAVDIFGSNSVSDQLLQVAKKYKIPIITDSAQAPGVVLGDEYIGTKAEIGGFSLNYHKHIHTGEGGVIVTNNDELALRCKLIRNHAEAVIEGFDHLSMSNMIGHNFRMGETEAAIGREQLKKLPSLVAQRQHVASRLIQGLKDLNGLSCPSIDKVSEHAFYVLGMSLDKHNVSASRDVIVDALTAEGVQGLMKGYQNIHKLPLFQKTGIWNKTFSMVAFR